MQAEALGRGVPRLAALEELEGLGVGREPLHGLGREHLDGGDDGLDLAALARESRPLARRRTAITSATSDSIARDDVARRRALLGDQRQQAVARLGERREELERLEGGGQALAVALVARAADDGVAASPAAGAAAASRAARSGLRGESSAVGRQSDLEDRAAGMVSPPSAGIGSGGQMVEAPACRSLSRRYASSACPTLARVSSRPSSATVSKIPGETVVPVERHAERLEDLPAACAPCAPARPRSAVSSALLASTARARSASAARASSSRSGASGEPSDLLARRRGHRPDRRRRSRPAARTRRASRSSPARSRPRRAARSRPGQVLQARGQVVERRARAGSGRSCGAASARRTPPATSRRARARTRSLQLVGGEERRRTRRSPSRAARGS